jgi:hypothetical protein
MQRVEASYENILEDGVEQALIKFLQRGLEKTTEQGAGHA